MQSWHPVRLVVLFKVRETTDNVMKNTIAELTKECADTLVKIEDLRVYMTDIFEKSEEEMALLEEQRKHMCSVLSVLEKRIELIKNFKNKQS